MVKSNILLKLISLANQKSYRRQRGGAVAARIAVSDLEFCFAHLCRDESPRARLGCSENIDRHGQTEIACAHLLLNILEHTFATPPRFLARSHIHTTHTRAAMRAHFAPATE